jgi:restriction system protein
VVSRRLGKNARNARGLIVLLVSVLIAVVLLAALARNSILLVLVLAGGIGLFFWRSKVRGERWRQLEEARRREAEMYAARAAAIKSYHAMTAREFEEALAWLCRRDGCLEAYVTGKAGDLGADVKAVTPDGRIMVIQAKRYVMGNPVTGPDLQKFGGTCYTVHRAQVAAVVTTSGFTKQARRYASVTGIALFDNDALAGWAARNGPPPWFAVPPPLVPVPSPGQEPRGKHSRPAPR